MQVSLILSPILGPARWRETGINYHLTLFNEYAFQQVDFRGFVVVDNAHVCTFHSFHMISHCPTYACDR